MNKYASFELFKVFGYFKIENKIKIAVVFIYTNGVDASIYKSNKSKSVSMATFQPV